MAKSTELPALPDTITIDTERTAVLIVDMQNAFASKGGMFHKVRGQFDARKIYNVIKANSRVIKAARGSRIPVVYLRHRYRPGLSNAGGPNSPNYFKEVGMSVMHKDRKLIGKFITAGTWDANIVKELAPKRGDVIVDKSRYSGFVNTDLQAILATHNSKYLIVSGIATNVCVESTIRDAFFREYFPILVRDGCAQVGPDYVQEATIWNVQNLFGWVTTSNDVAKAL